MQNIHAHAWEQNLHFEEQTVIETDISRGYRLDLTVKIEPFLRDMEPFERVAVFGLKAKRTGYWVPDQTRRHLQWNQVARRTDWLFWSSVRCDHQRHQRVQPE